MYKIMNNTVLVTGATGSIGSLVIPELIKRGVAVRAYVRNTDKASNLSARGATLFEGDFSDQQALNRAAAGTDAVLAITPANPNAVEQGEAILKATLNAGTPYYVRISAIGAAPDAPTANGRLHYQSDQALIASGLPYTILRPHYYMQNLFASAPTIKADGNMYWGMGDGKLGMIDIRDIADACVSLLVQGGHEGKIYTPTGPATISFHDIASIIAESLGKPVQYIPISIETVGAAIREAGWGDWGAQVMMDYSRAYAAGWGDFVNNDVKTITGQQPRSFAQFNEEILSGALKN
jgi:uncharacterized protein YbjT (DUF2867 family)